MNADC